MPALGLAGLITGALNVAYIAAIKGIGAIALAHFLVPAALTVVGGFLLQKLAPRVDPGGLELTGASARTIRAAVLPARWVLGRARVAGAMVWLHEDDRFLHAIYALAEAPCDAVEALWINGEQHAITITGDAHALGGARVVAITGTYAGGRSGTRLFQAQLYLSGSGFHALPGGASFAGAALPWTSSHRLTGIAWVYVRLYQPDYGTDIDDRVWSALPEIAWLVRGQRFTWPGQETEAWTDNAAAIRHWWLTERRGIPRDQIDRTLFDSAYALCGQQVSLAGLEGFSEDYPAEITRYTVNGVLTAGEQPEAVEAHLDAAWAGYSVEFDGMHRFLPGGERAAVAVIGPDDIVRPPVFRPGPEQHERVNRITARLRQSSLDRWTERVIEAVDDDDAQARDGEVLQSDLGTLTYVSDPVQALNLLTINLRRERAVAQVDLTIRPGDSFRNLTLAPGDVVHLILPEWGIAADRYMVVSSEVEENWEVQLGLVEQPAGLYADTLVLPPIEGTFVGLPPEQPTDPDLPQVAPPTALQSLYFEPNGGDPDPASGEPLEAFLSWTTAPEAQGYQYQLQPATVTAPVEEAWCLAALPGVSVSLWQPEAGGDITTPPGPHRWWVRSVRLNHRPSAAVPGPTELRVVEAIAPVIIVLNHRRYFTEETTDTDGSIIRRHLVREALSWVRPEFGDFYEYRRSLTGAPISAGILDNSHVTITPTTATAPATAPPNLYVRLVAGADISQSGVVIYSPWAARGGTVTDERVVFPSDDGDGGEGP